MTPPKTRFEIRDTRYEQWVKSPGDEYSHYECPPVVVALDIWNAVRIMSAFISERDAEGFDGYYHFTCTIWIGEYTYGDENDLWTLIDTMLVLWVWTKAQGLPIASHIAHFIQHDSTGPHLKLAPSGLDFSDENEWETPLEIAQGLMPDIDTQLVSNTQLDMKPGLRKDPFQRPTLGDLNI